MIRACHQPTNTDQLPTWRPTRSRPLDCVDRLDGDLTARTHRGALACCVQRGLRDSPSECATPHSGGLAERGSLSTAALRACFDRRRAAVARIGSRRTPPSRRPVGAFPIRSLSTRHPERRSNSQRLIVVDGRTKFIGDRRYVAALVVLRWVLRPSVALAIGGGVGGLLWRVIAFVLGHA